MTEARELTAGKVSSHSSFIVRQNKRFAVIESASEVVKSFFVLCFVKIIETVYKRSSIDAGTFAWRSSMRAEKINLF